MSAENSKTFVQTEKDISEFSLDFSDDEDDSINLDYAPKEAKAALWEDIDENVQFLVDCIQSSVPGAVILPIGSFNDKFDDENGVKKRCEAMKNRLFEHEKKRVDGITRRLKKYRCDDRENSEEAEHLRMLLAKRPKLILSNSYEDVARISSNEYIGFSDLIEKIVHIATGRELRRPKFHPFSGHIGARFPRMRLEVKDLVKQMRNKDKHFIVDLDHFYFELEKKNMLFHCSFSFLVAFS